MTEALKTGATIGILGGGQLGRMLAVAAARLGFRTHIFEPGANPPAGDVAHTLTTAGYDDVDALTAFAKSVDIVTFEFENIPTDALDVIENIAPIRPNREALRTSQDRLVEKQFLEGLGLTVAPFADIANAADLEAAITTIGAPSILKTRRFGYDGKGQARINPGHQLPGTLHLHRRPGRVMEAVHMEHLAVGRDDLHVGPLQWGGAGLVDLARGKINPSSAQRLEEIDTLFYLAVQHTVRVTILAN